MTDAGCPLLQSTISFSWWMFRILNFLYFCSEEGKGESEAPGGRGGRFFIENPRRRGGSRGGGGGGGAGRVFAGIWGRGGG